MSSEIPLKSDTKQTNLKAQKEAQKIKEMHDAQLRLAAAARERQKEKQAKLMAELENGAGKDDAHAVSREMLEKMIKECTPGETFDEDVKTALLQLADDFVEEVAMQSHKLAKLRNADVIDVKDVALHLEREWDIVVPGTSREGISAGKSARAFTSLHALKNARQSNFPSMWTMKFPLNSLSFVSIFVA